MKGLKSSGKIHKKIMSTQEIMTAVFLVAVLFLVLPSFLNTNNKLKQFIKNLSIWAIIVFVIVVIIYLIL